MTATRRGTSEQDYFANTVSNRIQSRSTTVITLRIVRISDHLMFMDFDPAITGIASQPFWLHWQDEDGRDRRHPPDFFALEAAATSWVIVAKLRPASPS